MRRAISGRAAALRPRPSRALALLRRWQDEAGARTPLVGIDGRLRPHPHPRNKVALRQRRRLCRPLSSWKERSRRRQRRRRKRPLLLELPFVEQRRIEGLDTEGRERRVLAGAVGDLVLIDRAAGYPAQAHIGVEQRRDIAEKGALPGVVVDGNHARRRILDALVAAEIPTGDEVFCLSARPAVLKAWRPVMSARFPTKAVSSTWLKPDTPSGRMMPLILNWTLGTSRFME